MCRGGSFPVITALPHTSLSRKRVRKLYKWLTVHVVTLCLTLWLLINSVPLCLHLCSVWSYFALVAATVRCPRGDAGCFILSHLILLSVYSSKCARLHSFTLQRPKLQHAARCALRSSWCRVCAWQSKSLGCEAQQTSSGENSSSAK